MLGIYIYITKQNELRLVFFFFFQKKKKIKLVFFFFLRNCIILQEGEREDYSENLF